MTAKLAAKIRTANIHDAPALAHLFSASWRQAYRGIIPFKTLENTIKLHNANWWKNTLGRSSKPIVMIFDNTLIGYASSGPARYTGPPFDNIPCGEIYELYLAPDYQGCGFGAKLFAATRSELKKKNLAPLIVWALSENTQAVEFYRSLGGRPRAFAEDKFGEAVLAKTGFYWP